MASNYILGNIGVGQSATASNPTSAASTYQANQVKPVYTGNGITQPNSALTAFLNKVDVNTAKDSPLSSSGATSSVRSSSSGATSSVRSSGSSGSSGGGRTSAKKVAIDYLNADLAKHYGLSAETAYQEALSNTAYQRAVKDLKAAGLNPVLAMGKVAGADSFAAEPVTQQGGGGGGGGSRRKQDDKSGVDWNKVSKIVSTVATVANTAIKIAGAF